MTTHGVILKRFPNSLLNHLGALAGQVMNDLASDDPLSRKVMDHILKFRKDTIAWSKVSEQAYLAARALGFKFAQPSSG